MIEREKSAQSALIFERDANKMLTLRGAHRYQRVGNAVTFRMSYRSPSNSHVLGNGGGIPVFGIRIPEGGMHVSN